MGQCLDSVKFIYMKGDRCQLNLYLVLMKKLFVLALMILLTGSLSFAGVSKYYVDDQGVETLFSQSQEITAPFAPLNFNLHVDHSFLEDKSRVTAGILALFLGAFGVHRAYSGSPFKVWGVYLGSTLCLSSGCLIGMPLIGLSSTWAIVDGIIILAGTDESYQSDWVNSEKLFNW